MTARLAHLLLGAGVALAAALIAWSVIAVLRYRDAFPYYDLILVDYRYFTPPMRDFWIFRDNEHLPLAAMPFFWADLRLFAGQGLFLVLSGARWRRRPRSSAACATGRWRRQAWRCRRC